MPRTPRTVLTITALAAATIVAMSIAAPRAALGAALPTAGPDDLDLTPRWFHPPIREAEQRTRSLEQSRLAPDLQSLHDWLIVGGTLPFPESDLQRRVQVELDGEDSTVAVLVRLTDDGRDGAVERLAAAGFIATVDAGQVVVGHVPVAMLPRLALTAGVDRVDAVGTTPAPSPVDTIELLQPVQAERTLLPPDFGVRGRGVIVAIIDSGIDWMHPDFRDELGLSRILALYDIFDESWAESNGAIGTEPPHTGPKATPRGTVYTQFQINEAILGRGTVNHVDSDGHGTLVAGVAAGGGRGVVDGVDPAVARKYRGVASEADLLIVSAMDNGGFPNDALTAALSWIVDEAKLRNRPVVINMSLGAQGTMKDGAQDVEQVIDQISGPGIPGVAVVVAAGNEGRHSLHAATRFGPMVEGQLGVTGEVVQVIADGDAPLVAIVKYADNFGIGIQGLPTVPGAFLVDEAGAPQGLFLDRPEGNQLVRGRSANISDMAMHAFFALRQAPIQINQETGDVRFEFTLPAGRYLVWGYGAGPNVPHGTVSFYLPKTAVSSFGMGTRKSEMVGSPGNARHAVTVGSYDFRSRWQTLGGAWVGHGVGGGHLSDFSNPGFRRDGLIKPDIIGPGRWAISARSSHATVEPGRLADSGMHAAWTGTSASAPYVAGVIALMLEHNPTLDVEQIRQLLIDTAIEDDFTGPTPNIGWGHGKINAAMAIGRVQSSRPTLRPPDQLFPGAAGAP